jgi:hypothetical protein
MMVAGVLPCSSAAEYIKGLNDEPGWRAAWVARLNLLIEKSKPPERLVMAPSLGSTETTAPCASGTWASAQPPPFTGMT